MARKLVLRRRGYVPMTPTHYVSASATDGDGSAGDPWTPAQAMAGAVAGNVVQFATGRYTLVGTGVWHTPTLNPTNSGSAGSPIVFQGDGGTVDFAFSSGTGSPFGVKEKDYITWRGFTVDQALCPGASGDQCCVVLDDANHCIVEHCDLDGNGGVGIATDDLHAGVRIDGQGTGRNQDNIVRYCTIHDVSGTSDTVGNCFAIQCLDSQGITYIEHNTLIDSNGGFVIKRSNGQNAAEGRTPPTGKWHIRYNSIANCYHSIRIDQFVASDVAYSADVYQNLVIGRADGIGFIAWNYATTYISRHLRVVNNTFVECGNVGALISIDASSTDVSHVLWNNIFVDCGVNVASVGTLANFTPANVDAEHNMYHGATTHFLEGFEASEVAKTFAQWQAASQDGASPAGFETADPKFVNEAGGDYRLAADSPARDAGVDVLNVQGLGTDASIDCGCYVTGGETIGVS